jgi:glycosyltransferase involved in cell wall biosynthesis
MWVSVSPDLQSSFSVVSKELLSRLRGYSTLYLAQHYFGEPRPEKNYIVASYSAGDHILHYLNVFKPDITVFFQSPTYLERLNRIAKFIKEKTRLIIYTPIEGTPLSVDVNELFNQADLILVPSKYSQECLRKRQVHSEVLMHGVDTNVFKPSPKPNNFTIGTIASHVWRKQLTRIIDAHKIAVAQGFKIRCLMVTSTYDVAAWMPNIKTYARQTNPQVYFNETAYLNLPVNEKAIATLYNQMHCHVLTSTEAFGLPNLEAMASATVPIVIPHGGSPEVVGDCGIYVEVKDYLDTAIGKIALVNVEDLADKIMWAHQHPSELAKLAVKGIQRAKLFNWENITTRLESLLAD